MSKLSDDDVRHIAKLAHLPLSKDELETYKNQLSEVVEYVEQLKEVDISDIEPTSQTTGLINVFREDEVDPTRTLLQKDALGNSRRTHNNFFVVDLILKNKDE